VFSHAIVFMKLYLCRQALDIGRKDKKIIEASRRDATVFLLDCQMFWNIRRDDHSRQIFSAESLSI